MLQADVPFVSVFRKLALTCALSVVGLGLLVVIGWAFHIQALKSLNPAWVTMKPNTAVGFILMGTALTVVILRVHSATIRYLALALSVLAMLLALTTAIQFLFHFDTGLDQILFAEDPTPISTAQPGRMAIRTIALFLVLGCSVGTLLVWPARVTVRFTGQILSVLVFLCALSAVMTYLYGGVPSRFSVTTTPIAYHTAFGFLLLGVGLFFAEPEAALSRIFTRQDLGGMLARRVMPMVVLAPTLIGWLRYLGEQAHLFTAVEGVIISSMLYVTLFSLMVLASAVAISRLERQRRKAEEISDRVFTMSLDLMCIANFDGYFLRVNSAFADAMGYTQAELTSRPYLEFIHPEDRGKTSSEADRNASAQNSLQFENRYLRRDGTALHLSWSATPYPAEGLIFGAARDITQQKMRIAEINSLNAQLAGKVDELAEAMRELEAFSYSVSHDLRAPLRHIGGYIEMLRADSANRLEEKGLRFLNTIASSARQMGQLIDGLLTFSRMGRSALTMEPIDSNALVDELIAMYKSASDAKPVIWKRAPLPPVRGDRTMLRQVWANLIENGLKYSRNRPAPAIEIDGYIEDNQAVFSVKDNGVGFDPQFKHKLFGVFQRLHTTREFEGTGIGLANVQRIVTRHGGRAWAKGILDGGATFFFSLPVDRPASSGASRSAVPGAGAASMTANSERGGVA